MQGRQKSSNNKPRPTNARKVAGKVRLDGAVSRALRELHKNTSNHGPALTASKLHVADEQFRLLVMYAAWWCDKRDRDKARTYIAAVKVQTAEVLHDVVRRALHIHGALGCSNEMPLISAVARLAPTRIVSRPVTVRDITSVTSAVNTRKTSTTMGTPPTSPPPQVAGCSPTLTMRPPVISETTRMV